MEFIDNDALKLAKDQPARHLHRYHCSGGEQILTFLGFMDWVAHNLLQAPNHGDNTMSNIVGCLAKTFGLSRRQIWAFYHTSQAAKFGERRDVMFDHIYRVCDRIERKRKKAA